MILRCRPRGGCVCTWTICRGLYITMLNNHDSVIVGRGSFIIRPEICFVIPDLTRERSRQGLSSVAESELKAATDEIIILILSWIMHFVQETESCWCFRSWDVKLRTHDRGPSEPREVTVDTWGRTHFDHPTKILYGSTETNPSRKPHRVSRYKPPAPPAPPFCVVVGTQVAGWTCITDDPIILIHSGSAWRVGRYWQVETSIGV